MVVLFVYIRLGVMTQQISVYHADFATQQLSILKSVPCSLENLELKMVEVANEYKTKYINILNDKDLENMLIDKYNFKKWEELF